MLEITTPPPPPTPHIKGKEILKQKEKQRSTRQILVLPRRALTQVSLVLKHKKFLTNEFFKFCFYFSKLYFTCFDHKFKKDYREIFLLSIPHSCSTDCFSTIPTFYRKVLKHTTQCLDDMKGEGRKCPRNKMYIDDIRLLFKFQNSNHLIILLIFIYKTRLYI